MKLSQVGVQLYTVRDFCKTREELAGSLARIRDIGYRNVELVGTYDLKPAELAKLVEDAGLQACSLHAGNVLTEPEYVAEYAENLKCKQVVYSYPSGFDLTKKEDVRAMLEALARAGRAYRELGKTLCYHHHSVEFQRLEGRLILDWILEEVPAGDLCLELDTYWIQHGGGSPAKWCRKLAGRIPVLHLKDYGNVKGVPTMMEVGNGNLEFPEIFAESERAGCQWWIVEQDTCPGDPFESLSISYRNLSKLVD